MPASEHTFAAKCRLAPVSHPKREDGLPPVAAQFFYSSIIPIDDPLSTGSVIGSHENRSSKGQLRPFSRGDNNALEKAWLGLMSDDDRRDHLDATHGRLQAKSLDDSSATNLRRSLLVQALATKHLNQHRTAFQPQDIALPILTALPGTPSPACCSQLHLDTAEELQQTFCALARSVNPYLTTESVLRDIVTMLHQLRQSQSASSDRPSSSGNDGLASTAVKDDPNRANRAMSIPTKEETHGRSKVVAQSDQVRPRSTSLAVNRSSRNQASASNSIARPPVADDGISGMPFVRVGSVDAEPFHTHPSPTRADMPTTNTFKHQHQEPVPTTQQLPAEQIVIQQLPSDVKYRRDSEDVAVGISRLHMVTLPLLQMKPIYWSPVNDIALVMRATWFYRDTMLPVPPAVANQLEAGYQELKPWTETWADELRCAVDIGPAGEEKISHRLWPLESNLSHKKIQAIASPLSSTDPFCAARCFRGEVAATGSLEPVQVDKEAAEPPLRAFSTYHVIYKNETEAFLLKPSLKPSSYYSRRPISKITKGVTVGVPVIRGFDRQVWDRAHESKSAPNKPGVSAATESHESRGHGVCPACKADKERGQVSDLVLVAHGIGQKFAERVESFHFTHAINGFRRAVNIELGNPIVRQVLREGQNGVMILPLNWRLGLSFEDGGPQREEDKADYAPEGFSLKDIEPGSIPAVRSMISDVMFDIPFYMSHHKSKMIKALVSEANRVYRLWCRNNPGFPENGRVHMIGHSLGSAMALEILSRQPTSIPRLDMGRAEPETRFLEFDTKNLFLVGSPAGFFLLLERGILVPRRGRMKPGADPGDTVTRNVVGEAGTFGCLAVDNIYNILAKEDPIAYLLNGAIDPVYASSLKMAYLPSAASTFLKSMGDAVRSIVPGMAPPINPLGIEGDRPPPIRLPSQLELEVHDFTREELAEKKAYLLNDNGQIDWYLRSGGGPLELQYLNMLGAHTSYWTNQDFIRMLCVEIGRKPGRMNTLPAMRAVKATKRMVPSLS
ncbi:hypothetical protein S7711_05240 [Stachybotrys chartarum IBT 7711]|uniref:DDHD domain-containing protein n=1 Tax=Stachybotrys chartarum (strain CBS 109288 / IBT 7711) TaxID=1280523 RepID=A0A084AGJ2_STACB|nr:hypothetical protein S7711_05240 [Stachybotrys chartarum IBT 7711]